VVAVATTVVTDDAVSQNNPADRARNAGMLMNTLSCKELRAMQEAIRLHEAIPIKKSA